jgi:hypothetical protein
MLSTPVSGIDRGLARPTAARSITQFRHTPSATRTEARGKSSETPLKHINIQVVHCCIYLFILLKNEAIVKEKSQIDHHKDFLKLRSRYKIAFSSMYFVFEEDGAQKRMMLATTASV